MSATFARIFNDQIHQDGKNARQYSKEISNLKPEFAGDRAKIAAFAQDLGLIESLATDGSAIFRSTT